MTWCCHPTDNLSVSCACAQSVTLGVAWGFMAKFGAASWRDLVAYAFLPVSEARFWPGANAHYRAWSVRFLYNALTVGFWVP